MGILMTLEIRLRASKAAALFIVLGLALYIVAPQLADAQTTPAPATREIKILADGSIQDSNPSTPLIQLGNVYTFSGDVYGRIDIEKEGVVLDGAGYSLVRRGDKDFGVMVGNGMGFPQVNGVTVKNLRVEGFRYAISLRGTGNVVSEVTVTGGDDYNGVGVWVEGSGNTIQGCRIVGNKGHGILVIANYTTIIDNVIADNGNYGIYFYNAVGRMRNNALNNNTAGPFHMEEMQLQHPGVPFRITSNDIDPSNTVDGKPVYYWVNEHGKTVPSDAGYVVLDNCTGITVDGLSIIRPPTLYPSYRVFSISLIRSSNILVRNSHLENTGIWCSYSSKDITLTYNTLVKGGIDTRAANTSILMNTITNPNATAITLGGQPLTATVAKNIISACEIGIKLESASSSRILQNNLSNCNIGIDIFSSNNNTITRNNFLGNTKQVYEAHSALVWPLTQYYQSLNNVWDGNYWSTYTGLDANGDGVGDTPYVVFENITDNRPLMTPFDISTEIPEAPKGSVPPTPQPTDAPTNALTDQPTATANAVDNNHSESFPILPLIAGVAVAVLIGACLAAYAKRKHPHT